MRTLSRLNRWPDGWLGVVLAVILPFVTAAFLGLALLDHDADYALPMAACFALGGGIGQLIRMRWPKRAKQPAWPVNAAPPRRPD